MPRRHGRAFDAAAAAFVAAGLTRLIGRFTVEAGIGRVADALDMAKGRSRIPFEHGRVSIHSLSAAAIDSVQIRDGENAPISIEIAMNNSSGVYQVDELLKAKLRGSGLEPYVEVVARIDTPEELSYYKHGGILPYVLRQLVGGRA